MENFLCVVCDRKTKKELWSVEVEAVDDYYARHVAARKYRNLDRSKDDGSWYVDSVKLNY